MARAPKGLSFMPTSLRDLLQKYRSKAISEREKGTYFEQLTKIWLENAPTQRAQFKRVLSFADWANENDLGQGISFQNA
jgi:predicted helicase